MTAWLDRRLYDGYGDGWDHTLFRDRILAEISTESHLLDLGAGAGIVPQMSFRGLCQRVCGVDPDERVVENPMLDEGKVALGESIPYGDAEFDIVISNSVFEHLDNPQQVMAEIQRVLKPGGVLMFKTPSKHHYVALIATITPHRFHQYVNKLRGRDYEDTFPTRYRANSAADVQRLAAATGFKSCVVDFVDGRPEYLRPWAPLYLLGAAYERVVNRSSRLARFRAVMFARVEN